MSAPSILALDAAQAAQAQGSISNTTTTLRAHPDSPWRYVCPTCDRPIPVLDDLTLATHHGPKQRDINMRMYRPECIASGVEYADEVILSLAWLSFARVIISRLRLSPAAQAVDRLIAHAINTAPTEAAPRAEFYPALDAWNEALKIIAGSVLSVPELPRSLELTHGLRDRNAFNRVMLDAIRDRLDSIAPRAILAALDALLTELRHEVAGALRWYVTPHAVDRYGERFAGHAFQDEIRATLHRIAGTATHGAPAERGIAWSTPDYPRVRLVVADNTVVTVLDTGQWRRVDSGRAANRGEHSRARAEREEGSE